MQLLFKPPKPSACLYDSPEGTANVRSGRGCARAGHAANRIGAAGGGDQSPPFATGNTGPPRFSAKAGGHPAAVSNYIAPEDGGLPNVPGRGRRKGAGSHHPPPSPAATEIRLS